MPRATLTLTEFGMSNEITLDVDLSSIESAKIQIDKVYREPYLTKILGYCPELQEGGTYRVVDIQKDQ